MGFSVTVASGGSSLVAVHGPLIVVTSLAVGHRLYCAGASVAGARGLSSFSFQALEHRLNSCGARA